MNRKKRKNSSGRSAELAGIGLILIMTILVNGCGNDMEEISLEEILSGVPPEMPQTVEEVSGTVWVHICGEVCSPGIYELPAGSRIYDALMAAGGFTEAAAEDYYNLAATVSDGMKIQVPSEGEEQSNSTAHGETSATATGGESEELRVNINTATAKQLQTLPGIGAGRAADIIAYREKNGGFRETTQIMEVSGIKEAIFEKIKDLISVE